MVAPEQRLGLGGRLNRVGPQLKCFQLPQTPRQRVGGFPSTNYHLIVASVLEPRARTPSHADGAEGSAVTAVQKRGLDG